MNEKNWINSCIATNFDKQIEDLVKEQINRGAYNPKDIEYISNLKKPIIQDSANINQARLETLRRLCQLWCVDIKISDFSSHRKFIGPIIINLKKITYPIFRLILKDFIKQQRDFNSEVILLLADLSKDKK